MHCWFLTACFFEVIGVAWILKNMFSDCEVWKGELQERIWLSWVCVQSTEQGLKVDVETGEGFEPMLRIGRNMFRQMKRGRGWENQRYPRNNLLIAGWVLLKCGRKLRRQSLTNRYWLLSSYLFSLSLSLSSSASLIYAPQELGFHSIPRSYYRFCHPIFLLVLQSWSSPALRYYFIYHSHGIIGRRSSVF